MEEPPAEIRDFHEHIRSLSLQDLAKDPRFIDLNAHERQPLKSPLLRDSYMTTMLKYNSEPMQEAFLGFTGRCLMGCPREDYHTHHRARYGEAFQLKGFEGLHIQPKLYAKALPELLEHFLEPHVTATDTDTRHDSFELSPYLAGLLVESFGGSQQTEDLGSAAMYISTATQQIGLRQALADDDKPFAYLTLGCDAILVFGCQEWETDDEDMETLNKAETRLAALRVRAGDVLLLDFPGGDVWYGIAKVLDASSQLFEQWPHLRKDERYSEPQPLRGQLAGKTVEVEVRPKPEIDEFGPDSSADMYSWLRSSLPAGLPL